MWSILWDSDLGCLEVLWKVVSLFIWIEFYISFESFLRVIVLIGVNSFEVIFSFLSDFCDSILSFYKFSN